MLLPYRALVALTLCGSAIAHSPDDWPKNHAWSGQHGWPSQHESEQNFLIVSTDSGTSYRGLINGSAPHVRVFQGIPFAQPPTESLRWLPPQPLNKTATSGRTLDATQYPPSCPQYRSQVPTVYTAVDTNYIIAGPVSEDCLALSIWTPVDAEGLPVVMFMTGGGFQTGGVEINYQLPYNWVERTRKHIVVTINYRVNIFGFPNAAGLDEQNLGLLDQRAALEWVRDNIKAFGGDPSRITLWGQSAGAASVDYQNFAYHNNPIVTGFFAQSGSVFLGLESVDRDHTNFTFVAGQVGCDHPNDASAELDCMRSIPFQTITDFVGEYSDNATQPAPGFNPVPDEQLVFSNYTARYATNKVSQRPAIFTTTENEGVALVPFSRSGVNQTAADQVTRNTFLCPATESSRLRTAAGLTTYRALYSGNFSNVSPLPWMGAYHASDLPMLFATHQDYPDGEGSSTDFEFAVSQGMEDMLLAFMKNPETGLLRYGWAPHESGQMLEWAADGVVMRNVSVESVDAVCS